MKALKKNKKKLKKGELPEICTEAESEMIREE